MSLKSTAEFPSTSMMLDCVGFIDNKTKAYLILWAHKNNDSFLYLSACCITIETNSHTHMPNVMAGKPLCNCYAEPALESLDKGISIVTRQEEFLFKNYDRSKNDRNI